MKVSLNVLKSQIILKTDKRSTKKKKKTHDLKIALLLHTH